MPPCASVLPARSSQVDAEVQAKFTQYSLSTGVLQDNIVFLPSNGKSTGIIQCRCNFFFLKMVQHFAHCLPAVFSQRSVLTPEESQPSSFPHFLKTQPFLTKGSYYSPLSLWTRHKTTLKPLTPAHTKDWSWLWFAPCDFHTASGVMLRRHLIMRQWEVDMWLWMLLYVSYCWLPLKVFCLPLK